MFRPNLVRMITRHSIDLGSSNLIDICIGVLMIPIDFEINLSKVKVTETINMLVYRLNLVLMITRHGIDKGSSNLAQSYEQNL